MAITPPVLAQMHRWNGRFELGFDLGDLLGGDVDRDPGVLPIGLKPGGGTAGLAQHPGAELDDQAALLGDRDEVVGRDQAPNRVVPPDQRLEAGDPVGAEVDRRLGVQDELLGLILNGPKRATAGAYDDYVRRSKAAVPGTRLAASTPELAVGVIIGLVQRLAVTASEPFTAPPARRPRIAPAPRPSAGRAPPGGGGLRGYMTRYTPQADRAPPPTRGPTPAGRT